jgi:hypothetical protein
LKNNSFELKFKGGIETYFFGCLDGHEIFVNLLRFGCHLLGFGVAVIFDGQPKFQVLVAVFAE